MPLHLLQLKSERITANRVVTTSFLVDILDIIINLIVSVLTGSAVMITQTLQGLADLAASGFLIIGVNQSGRKADSIHPFGYGRDLYFWTLLSAFVSLIVTSGLSIYLGWEHFVNPPALHGLPLAYAVLFISVFTNGYSTYLSSKRLLKGARLDKISSAFAHSPLIETKATFVLDLMGTTASVLGLAALILYGLTGDLHWDGVGAMTVGAVLGLMTILLMEALRGLIIGGGAPRELHRRIANIVISFPQVEAVTDLKTLHLSAEKLLVNLDIHARHSLTTPDLESLIQEIKTKVQAQIPEASEIQIELKTHRK